MENSIDTIIMALTPEMLLARDIIDTIYGIDDILERERIIALWKLRAKDVKCEKELAAVIRAYNNVEKELAENYRKLNAKNNGNVNLEYGSKGEPLSTINNFLQVLRNDKYFEGLQFNLLTFSPEQKKKGKIERWTDADDSRAREYIERKYRFHSTQKLDDALRIIFNEKEYHPVQQIIENVEWDGQARISNFLTKWLKADDNEYTQEVSRLIFAGGINRLYNPGCKFDDVPVLIGIRQGEGKSTFVRWLAIQDEFFTEINELEGQKGMEAVEGAWICELGELLALTKSKEVEAVKAYITRQVDRYRRPFDKRVTEHKRQCIFIGTTNKEQFLTDKTGNRRFYPVKIKQNGYDLFECEKEIKTDILQCWAEAKALFDKGELKPFACKTLVGVIKEHQKNAVEDDYRDGMIEAYLETKDETCVLELWQNALDMGEYSKPNKKDSNEIALIMQNCGEWEKQDKVKRFSKYGIQKWWARKNFNADFIQKLDDDLPF